MKLDCGHENIQNTRTLNLNGEIKTICESCYRRFYIADDIRFVSILDMPKEEKTPKTHKYKGEDVITL